VNEYNQKVQLTFNNLKTDGATELASFNERIGEQKLSPDNWPLALKAKSWRCWKAWTWTANRRDQRR
jgi:uncharacterized protein YdgA (DUF945 family)